MVIVIIVFICDIVVGVCILCCVSFDILVLLVFLGGGAADEQPWFWQEKIHSPKGLQCELLIIYWHVNLLCCVVE